MTAPYSAGRGFVTAGLLLLAAAVGATVVVAHVLPAGISATITFASIAAGLAACIGQAYVGFVLAFGGRGASGIAGPTWWARAACVGFGVGQFASLVVVTTTSLAAGAQVAAIVATVIDLVLVIVTAVAAVAIARAGALIGFARWALGIVAATQLVVALLETGRTSALASPSAVLTGGVLPAVLVLVGITYLRSAKAAGASRPDDEAARFVTRAGRTSAQWVVDAPLHAVIARQRHFLAGQRRFTAARFDEQDTAAEVELAARPNWAAWGGRILLRFQSADDGTTIVDARWSPSIVTTILTWDQGQRDLQAIASGTARPEGVHDGVSVS